MTMMIIKVVVYLRLSIRVEAGIMRQVVLSDTGCNINAFISNQSIFNCLITGESTLQYKIKCLLPGAHEKVHLFRGLLLLLHSLYTTNQKSGCIRILDIIFNQSMPYIARPLPQWSGYARYFPAQGIILICMHGIIIN